MPTQCGFPAACVLGGTAYLVEGAAHSSSVLAYDRSSRRWHCGLHKMATPRVNMAAASLPTGAYVMVRAFRFRV